MRRMNFFDGFLATSQDWLAGQHYHLEKRQLHNRLAHGTGILPVGGRLRVRARNRDDLSFEVDTGVALDEMGRELILNDPLVKRLIPDDYHLPCTLHLCLEYEEQPTEWIEYPEHPSYKGHRSVEESCRLVISDQPGHGVELARIRLSRQIHTLRDAANPRHPAEGEIDLRFAPRLPGASRLNVQLAHSWTSALESCRASLRQVLSLDLPVSRDLLLLLDTLLMFQAAQLVNAENLDRFLIPILERERELGEQLEQSQPNISDHPRFSDYRRAIESSHRLLQRRSPASTPGEEGKAKELLALRLGANQALNDSLDILLTLNTNPSESLSWEQLRLRSSDFPASLEVEGLSLRLISVLQPADDDSIRLHQLVVEGEKDSWRSRQSFAYPDQQEVVDAGVSFVGGQLRFRVEGLSPGKDLVLIKRYDALYGEQSCELLVDGRSVGLWQVSGSDRRFRWRNHHFYIPARFITSSSVEVIKKAASAERDVNVFRFWFYQAHEG